MTTNSSRAAAGHIAPARRSALLCVSALTVGVALAGPAQAADPQGHDWTGATITISQDSGHCTITVSPDGNGSCTFDRGGNNILSASLTDGDYIYFQNTNGLETTATFTAAPEEIGTAEPQDGSQITVSPNGFTFDPYWDNLVVNFEFADVEAPTGYSVTAQNEVVTAAETGTQTVSFTGAEVGARYDIDVTSSGGGGPVTTSGTIANGSDQVALPDLAALADGTLTVSAVLTDPAGNAGPVATDSLFKDATAPSGVSMAVAGSALPGQREVTFEVVLSEQAAGLTSDAFVLEAEGTASGTIASVAEDSSGGVAAYSVTVQEIAGQGSLTLAFAEAALLVDGYGNAAPAGPDAPRATHRVDVDDTAPTVTLTGPESVPDGAFDVRIDFSETVEGFAAEDLNVEGGTLTELNGNSPHFFARVTPETGAAEVRISLAAGAAVDAGGNASLGATPLVVGLDIEGPTATAGAAPATVSGAFTVPLSFSEAVTGLDASDFAVEGGSLTLAGGPKDFVLTVTPDEEADAVSVSLPAGAASDAAGNPSAALVVAALVGVDRAPVTVKSEVLAATADRVDVLLAFNKPVSGLAADDFLVEGGQIEAIAAATAPSANSDTAAGQNLTSANPSSTGGGSARWRLTITPDGSAEVKLRLRENAVSDLVGNGNAAIGLPAIAMDLTAPAPTLAAPSARVTGPFTVTIDFGEAVTGFALSDLSVSNGVASAFSAESEAIYTALVTPSVDGEVVIALAAGAAQDAAGNDSETASLTVDFVDEEAIRTRTRAVTRNFLVRRADRIVAAAPDLGGRLRDRRGGTNRLTGSAEDRSADLAYDGKRAFGEGRLGLWAAGSWARTETEHAETDVLVAHAGADWALSDTLVVGVMVEVDRAEQDEEDRAFAVEGKGYMAGPYLAAEPVDGLILDLRAAWGGSENDVRPYASYEDEVKTDRRLYQGGLSGRYPLSEQWTAIPMLRVTHFRETASAYTDRQSVAIDGQEITVGRVTFGPVLEGRLGGEGTALSARPRLNVQGVWDFDTSDTVSLSTGQILGGTEDLRARLGAGIGIGSAPSGLVTADGFYDGIGRAGYDAYGVTITYRRDLN